MCRFIVPIERESLRYSHLSFSWSQQDRNTPILKSFCNSGGPVPPVSKIVPAIATGPSRYFWLYTCASLLSKDAVLIGLLYVRDTRRFVATYAVETSSIWIYELHCESKRSHFHYCLYFPNFSGSRDSFSVGGLDWHSFTPVVERRPTVSLVLAELGSGRSL